MEHFGNVPERSKGSDLRSLALCFVGSNPTVTTTAFLAQLVERKTFNLVVVGSSPTEGMINYQSNSEEKVSFVIVLQVMFPSGQRGATQDRLHYASWVRIPSLPRFCGVVG